MLEDPWPLSGPKVIPSFQAMHPREIILGSLTAGCLPKVVLGLLLALCRTFGADLRNGPRIRRFLSGNRVCDSLRPRPFPTTVRILTPKNLSSVYSPPSSNLHLLTRSRPSQNNRNFLSRPSYTVHNHFNHSMLTSSRHGSHFDAGGRVYACLGVGTASLCIRVLKGTFDGTVHRI